MKVLLVSGSIPPDWCGVGDYAALLAGALATQPDVEVAILTARGDLDDPRVTLLRTKDWSLLRTFAILRTILCWRPGVVHFQYPTAGYRGQGAPWVLPALCRLFGRRVVMTWHEERPRLHPGELLNALLPGGVVIARPAIPQTLSRTGKWLTSRKTFRFISVGCTLPVVELTDAQRETVRGPLTRGARRLIAYFGFAQPHKRVEDLFAVADAATDALVLICTLDPADAYQRNILERTTQPPWNGRCRVTGPLPADEVAKILASADAVVLTFASGAGTWNSSLRGAIMQGTFTLTTSLDERGYDVARNVYLAAPGDTADMRDALQRYAGTRRPAAAQQARDEWLTMAAAHLDFYRDLGIVPPQAPS